MAPVEYKITDAREKLSAIYDRSRHGAVTRISRQGDPSVAVVPAERLMEALAVLAPLPAEVSFAEHGVAAWLANAPVHAHGADIDEAAHNLAGALRDYAELWEEELYAAPNHQDKWALVTRVQLLDDDQLVRVMFEDEPS
jgi:antitoxin (DNA-binding transcriptional repressor) of toxin-antitoxin stability system